MTGQNLTAPTADASPIPGLTPLEAAILGAIPSAAPDRAATANLVRAGSYFSLFSLPNPSSPNQPIPLIPPLGEALSIAFRVSEDLHRFDIEEWPPTPECGLRIRQNRSESGVARVSLKLVPMPNYYEADPSRTPPPTVLLPFLSQRFTPKEGSVVFKDNEESGFKAEGAGRTFPSGGGLEARLVAVLEAIETYGKLAGLPVTGIVSGDIKPPLEFAFSVLFRAVDPGGRLRARVPPGPIAVPSDPTPQTETKQGTTFLQLLAEEDPAHPITVVSDGDSVRVTIEEKLRLVDLSFNVNPPGLRSVARPGAVVGRHKTTLILETERAGDDVIPAYSKDDEFEFFDAAGRPLGGFRADTFEARLMPTVDAGGAMMRIGGFAIPTEGTGQFTSPLGQVSINGAFSPVTGTVSTVYMIRLTVPDAVFKVVA